MNKQVQDYFKDWYRFIPEQELTNVLASLEVIYNNRTGVSPIKSKVFEVFNKTEYSKLKLVIIGQDPYTSSINATGFAFANPKDVQTISPSLRVIEHALINPNKTDYLFKKLDYSLENWVNQGVLLLNSVMTTELRDYDSLHAKVWRPFMTKFLENLSSANPGMIYILFGEEAKTLAPYINKGHILYEKHPSYYARTGTPMTGRVFAEANEWLKLINNDKIEWYEKKLESSGE